MLYQKDNRLVFKYDAEEVWIEPWGTNAFRVRATKATSMPVEDWALQSPVVSDSKISLSESEGSIVNGKIRATISKRGKIIIYNSKGETLLEEYARNRRDLLDPKCSAIEIEAREFKPLPGGDYHLTMRLESVSPKEKIYGMGQYQQDSLDLKGHDLELAHRNSQASVPFALSSLGYGLLWNNPGIGRAVLGKNIMSFEAYSTKVLDYWVVAGDNPAEIEEAYARATGTVPMMPEYGLGFWQCKLRYQTQEELLGVAREYRARNLPIDLIVIDFFHWPKQGDWKFDSTYWPDPGKFPEAASRSRANSSQRGYGQGAPRNEYRIDGIDLANSRYQIRKLRGNAREGLLDQNRPRIPNWHGLPRQHNPLRRNESGSTLLFVGESS